MILSSGCSDDDDDDEVFFSFIEKILSSGFYPFRLLHF